jgi:DNA-binding protein Fis
VNLRLFAAVLWRFKYVVAGGCAIAILLSVLSIAKVDLSHGVPRLTPRTQQIYASSAALLVTQSGFPWGSAVQSYYSSAGSKSSPVPAGDLNRLTALANLYVQLANSDVIKSIVARHSPAGGHLITASQNYSFSPSYYSSALPIVTINGTGTTRANAILTTQAGVDALSSYLRRQQNSARISDAQRVVLQEIQRPRLTTVMNPTKKTIPAVVFLTIMLAVVGLAFVLENLRPRANETTPLRQDVEPVVDAARRSA